MKVGKGQSPFKQMKEVGTELYYQILSRILGKLAAWRNQKDKYIDSYYLTTYSQLLQQTKNNHSIIELQCFEFMEILSDLKQSFSKLRIDNRKGIKNPERESPLRELKLAWIERKSQLLQLGEFSSTVHSVMNKQLSDIRKSMACLQGYEKKIKSVKGQYEHHYANKMQISNTKKKHKYFELGKIKECLSLFNEENAMHDIHFNSVQSIVSGYLSGVEGLLLDMKSNFQNFTVIYEKCFCEKGNQTALERIRGLGSLVSEKLREYKQNMMRLQERKEQEQKMIKQKLQQVLDRSVEELSISCWDVEVSSEGNKGLSQKKVILTLDYKLLILGNREIESEIYLLESQVSLPNEMCEITIKTQKKQKYWMKFSCEAKEDEFYLHIRKAQGQI